LWHGNIVKRG